MSYGDYGSQTVRNPNGTIAAVGTVAALRHGYTGRLHDTTTGLTEYRHRWMNPTAGTFLQRDPLGYVDGENLYTYVMSSPNVHYDPLGLTPEKDTWDDSGYQKYTEKHLDFWLEWLGAREIQDNDRVEVSPECRQRLLCIIRAISYVESRHGTGTGGSAKVDPMQVGNPLDEAHKSITERDRQRGPVREGNLPGVPSYNELPERVKRSYPAGGRDDQRFGPDDSFFWGIPWYIMRTNQSNESTPPKAAWNFRDCSWQRLIDGAVRYNGGGDEHYRKNIIDALKMSECYEQC